MHRVTKHRQLTKHANQRCNAHQGHQTKEDPAIPPVTATCPIYFIVTIALTGRGSKTTQVKKHS